MDTYNHFTILSNQDKTTVNGHCSQMWCRKYSRTCYAHANERPKFGSCLPFSQQTMNPQRLCQLWKRVISFRRKTRSSHKRISAAFRWAHYSWRNHRSGHVVVYRNMFLRFSCRFANIESWCILVSSIVWPTSTLPTPNHIGVDSINRSCVPDLLAHGRVCLENLSDNGKSFWMGEGIDI